MDENLGIKHTYKQDFLSDEKGLVKQMDKKTDFLRKQYETYSEEELREITVDNGYTEVAEQVAKELSMGEREVYKKAQEQEIYIGQKKLRINTARKENPLYDDIHQIAGDLRFIKNLIIIGLVCAFVLGVVGAISVL